jgi:HJR/Mrr/RecB family endonuclease
VVGNGTVVGNGWFVVVIVVVVEVVGSGSTSFQFHPFDDEDCNRIVTKIVFFNVFSSLITFNFYF